MPTIKEIKKEVEITTARSSGAGGQNVNKVESKVMLRWNIPASGVLKDSEKETVLNKLANNITKEGDLILTSESSRSQLKNKETAFKKLDRLLTKAFSRAKPRKATKPTKASKKRRIDSKKKQGEKKKWRQKLN